MKTVLIKMIRFYQKYLDKGLPPVEAA
ncbi:MAG: membrane protein insertion efficiency factor YidD, partial [Clostridiales bacterium]|nr:membrane protein insertion efficiency factor YidD [Clostridiales bacterium]